MVGKSYIKPYMMQGFAGEHIGAVSGGVWSVGSAGKWVNYWANFAPNVLTLSGFP